MLFRDFLRSHALILRQQDVLFDWSWPNARYELKINQELDVTHRQIRRDGSKGPWTVVKIDALRRFRIITVVPPARKLVNSQAAIRITTNDGDQS